MKKITINHDFENIYANFFTLKHQFVLEDKDISFIEYVFYYLFLLKTFGKTFVVFNYSEDKNFITISLYTIKKFAIKYDKKDFNFFLNTQTDAEIQSLLDVIIKFLYFEFSKPVLFNNIFPGTLLLNI